MCERVACVARGGGCSLGKPGAHCVLLLLLLRPGSRVGGVSLLSCVCLAFVWLLSRLCLAVVSLLSCFISLLYRFCLAVVSLLYRFCLAFCRCCLPFVSPLSRFFLPLSRFCLAPCGNIVNALWNRNENIMETVWEHCESTVENGESIVGKLWKQCESIANTFWEHCESIVKIVRKLYGNLWNFPIPTNSLSPKGWRHRNVRCRIRQRLP